jgi:hypothetical protein
MDISVIVAVGSCAATIGLVIRGLFSYLDRRGDRQLARHVFEQTRSTDGLNGYAKLRRAQRTALVSDTDPTVRSANEED